MEVRILELYKTLNITESEWPYYRNPHDFADRMQKCALTKNVITTQSTSTTNPEKKTL